jgi:hypothetical protein
MVCGYYPQLTSNNSSFFHQLKQQFMEKKIIFGTLGGAVAGLLVATVIYMGLLGSRAEQWQADNAACLNEMNPVWWLVASLVQALFYAILLHKSGISTFKGGAVAGIWITFLTVLYFGITLASTFKAYRWSWLPIDLMGNVVSGSIGAGVIGWIFGKVK